MLFALSGGCGGAGRSVEAPADTGIDRERQCLDDAAASRTPSADAPERIEVSHILVRHADLERPEGATRTPGEACLRALTALNALTEGGSWEEVSGEFSDAKNGSLGRVSQDELEPRFAAAAFSLEPGELSYVVETSRGFHVILRRN